MNFNLLRTQLQREGYIVVNNLLSEAEVAAYIQKLTAYSGVTREELAAISGRGFDKDGASNSWNVPDGVSKTPDFWPLIWHERLLELVHGLLGSDIRYLQHSDLHIGFSAVSWHRDNVNRTFGQGSDWDETVVPYRILRAGLYLQRYAESHFRLGFIPGSHRPEANIAWQRRLTEAKLSWLGGLSYLSPQFQMWASNAVWIATKPGDCLIFDPRILHSGSYITGPKYSIFLAYGLENAHFYRHQNYYRHIRTELNYQDLDSELVKELQARGLYPNQSLVFNQIEDAWIPTPLLKTYLGQRFKVKSSG